MSLEVVVYGFGSAFNDSKVANDIDLLIVHRDSTAEGCGFAIRFKRRLAKLMPNAHITVLSAREEAHFEFIQKSNARNLAVVRESRFDDDVAGLFHEIASHTLWKNWLPLSDEHKFD